MAFFVSQPCASNAYLRIPYFELCIMIRHTLELHMRALAYRACAPNASQDKEPWCIARSVWPIGFACRMASSSQDNMSSLLGLPLSAHKQNFVSVCTTMPSSTMVEMFEDTAPVAESHYP